MEVSLAAMLTAAATGIVGLLAGLAIARIRRGRRAFVGGPNVADDDEIARFQDVLELGYDWIWETDAQNRFVYLSPSFGEVTGQPAESVLGLSRFEMGRADLSDPKWAEHKDIVEAHQPFRGFVYSAALRGVLRWYRVSGKPRFDRSGRFVGYRGIGTDVTDQVLAEQRIEQNRQQLQRIIDAISHGVALYDQNDRLLAVNAAYHKLLPNVSDMARPGVSFREMVEVGAKRGIYENRDKEPAEVLVQRRLAARASGQPEQLFYADGRVLQVSETPLASGERLFQWVEVTRFRRRERALSLLLEAQAKEQDVIEAAAQALAIGLGYRCGGVIRRTGPKRAQILALWDGREMCHDIEYDLNGTPCEEIYDLGGCYYASDTCRRFPHDALLVEFGVQAFRGVPLPSDTGIASGHVIAFDTNPGDEVPQDGDLLELIASWVSIELKRRESDEALAASESRFRDLVEIDTDWYWELDAELRLAFVSEGAERLIGRVPEQLLGHTLPEGVGISPGMPEWTRDGWFEVAREMRARRPFRELCLTVRTPKGRRHLRLSGRPLFDTEGRFAGYRGVAADETPQVTAQRALEENSQILRAIVDNMPEGVSIVDGDLNMLRCNQRFLDLLDVPQEVVAKGHFEDVIRYNAERGDYGSGDIEEMVRHRMELARNPVPHRFVRVRPNGTAIEVRGNPLPTGGFVTTYADVTEHQRMQSALQDSEARYRLISELTSDFLYSYRVRPDGKKEVEWFAGSLPESLGLPSMPETTFTAWDDFVHPQDRKVLEGRRQRLRAGEASIDELRVLARDGSIRWLRVVARPEMDAETGRLMRVLGAAQDITERKRAEAALREAKETAELANRTKSEFLANMSHELRTPLNAVIGFAEIMTNQVMGPLGHPRYKSYAEDIRDSGTHLLNIINDILDVSKAEAGMLDLTEEELELAAIVDAAVRLVRQRAETGGVRLVVDLPDDLPRIWADPRRMKQVLLNLLSNAVKFTPEKGAVQVEARLTQAGWLQIRVADQGIGIAPEDLDRVLEPFTQVDSSLSRRHAGTGLGLPLTRALIEMHDGTLRLESMPGAGTVATVALPPERLVDAESPPMPLASGR